MTYGDEGRESCRDRRPALVHAAPAVRRARVYVPWRRAPLEPWPQMTSGDPFEAPAVVVELLAGAGAFQHQVRTLPALVGKRSEERRVGKECVSVCRSRWATGYIKKKYNTCSPDKNDNT